MKIEEIKKNWKNLVANQVIRQCKIMRFALILTIVWMPIDCFILKDYYKYPSKVDRSLIKFNYSNHRSSYTYPESKNPKPSIGTNVYGSKDSLILHLEKRVSDRKTKIINDCLLQIFNTCLIIIGIVNGWWLLIGLYKIGVRVYKWVHKHK